MTDAAGYWMVTTDGLDRTVGGVEAPGDGTPWRCPYPWHKTRPAHFRLAEEVVCSPSMSDLAPGASPSTPSAAQIVAWLDDAPGLAREVWRHLKAQFVGGLGSAAFALEAPGRELLGFSKSAAPPKDRPKEREESPGVEAEQVPRPEITWARLRAMDHKAARALFSDETGREVDGWGWDALESAYVAWESDRAVGGRAL